MAAGQFGDLLTADHFAIADKAWASRDGSMYGLVIQDKATMWIVCSPNASRGLRCVVPAVRRP